MARSTIPDQRPPSAGRSRVARLARALATLTVVGVLAGCNGIQSALDPASLDADRLYRLTTVLFAGGGAIFVGVMVLVLYAVYASPGERGWLGSRRTVIYGGVAFPSVTLSLLLPYGLLVMRDTDVRSPDALPIEVVGEQYWWRVRYPEDRGRPAFTTANEIHVPVGRPVTISVTSADVVHAFWIPNLGGKIDMIPGRLNALSFTADRPGIYRGVCTEFCGEQHALMAFDVVVHEPEDFDVWRAAQERPGAEPASDVLRRGKELFQTGGCGNCHAVRGTGFDGQLGPDLTHVGSRRTIGAGVFPNNVGTLAGWISDTQHLKGGARMPSYGSLPGEDLRALAGYLESLQ